MRDWLLCPVLAAALGCSGAARPGPTPSQPAARAGAVAAHPPRASTKLAKAFTGQAQPSLVVKNDFPIAQHVFIDWVHRAELAPAATQNFELSIGTHSITCADSPDPDDNPAAITERFDTGYAYSYDIRPSS